MCGIVGFRGRKKAIQNVFLGLKKLEYRGYDSWGIGYQNKNALEIKKSAGKISEVNLADFKTSAQIAIGHTRWATHGNVSDINAHPQIDCSGRIAVTHNGIIENYQELKKELQKKNHQFISETDTEVIPHLIEEYLKNNSILESIRKTTGKLQGNFAFLVLEKGNPNLYAVADGCPLAFGKSKDQYIASDILAFPTDVKEAIFFKEESLVEIGDEIKVIDIRTGKNKRVDTREISSEAIESGLKNYSHYLFKEINEQPDIVARISQMSQREIETNAALIRNSYGVFVVAAGTAYHAGLVGSYMFAQNALMHINTQSAGEFPNFGNFITEKTLFFAISQSGETADVLEAVKVAKEKKAKIFSLLNNPNSTLARLSNIVMPTLAGPEIAVLSTKTFTAQVAVLFLLSHAISNDLNSARGMLQKCSEAIRESLKLETIEKIKKLAQKLKNCQNLFTIGRSLNYPTALEAALKIKEATYIHAEGFAGSDLKHGPIALIERGTPCIVFVAEDATKDDIISNAIEVKSRGGYIIGVAPKNNEAFDWWISVADMPELSPIINIVPMQVLTYFLALERGLDPDKPRNLAKSVTVK